MAHKIKADYKQAVLTEGSPKKAIARVDKRDNEDMEQVTSNKDRQI